MGSLIPNYILSSQPTLSQLQILPNSTSEDISKPSNSLQLDQEYSLLSISFAIIIGLFLTISCLYCVKRGIHYNTRAIEISMLTLLGILFIMFIRAATLEGFNFGLKIMFFDQTSKIASIGSWSDAAVQALLQSGTARGCLINLASLRHTNNKIVSLSRYYLLASVGVGILSSSIVYGAIGVYLTASRLSFTDLQISSPLFVFAAYSEILRSLPMSTVWLLGSLIVLMVNVVFFAVRKSVI